MFRYQCRTILSDEKPLLRLPDDLPDRQTRQHGTLVTLVAQKDQNNHSSVTAGVCLKVLLHILKTNCLFVGGLQCEMIRLATLTLYERITLEALRFITSVLLWRNTGECDSQMEEK